MVCACDGGSMCVGAHGDMCAYASSVYVSSGAVRVCGGKGI